MAGITSAVAAKVLAKPLTDLYEEGKEKFDRQLAKWKNAAVRKQLASKIAAVEKVKVFWQRDREVRLSSFYFPGKVLYSEAVRKSADSLADFPQRGNYVIQGTIGQGKSIFLRHLCVQELRDVGSGRIPVFLELRSLTAAGLMVGIFNALDRLGFQIDDDLFDFYARTGKMVVLLDAFDELDETLIQSTITEIESLAETYATLQIFVTSRPSAAIQSSRHFRVIRLAPLTSQDHQPFLKRIGVPQQEAAHILQAIRTSSAQISSLLTTPLMMTLLVIVYRAENAVPSRTSEFYERLFQTLFSKHDSSKPGYIRKHKAGLGERQLQKMFEAFCFATLQLRLSTKLTPPQFNRCFDHTLKYLPFTCTPEGFKHDITKVTCLMQEEGFDLVYIHKSVVEFYAASFVRELTDAAAQRFYAQMTGSNSRPWRQVLAFLSQIDQYRYAKYYALTAMAEAMSLLQLDADSLTVANVEGVARILYKGINIRYNLGDQSETTPTYGPFVNTNPYLDDMDSGILQFMDIFGEEKNCSLEELSAKFPEGKFTKHRDDTETVFSIPWEHFVRVTGQWKAAMRFTEERVRQFLRERQKILEFIRAEDERAQLIEI